MKKTLLVLALAGIVALGLRALGHSPAEPLGAGGRGPSVEPAPAAAILGEESGVGDPVVVVEREVIAPPALEEPVVTFPVRVRTIEPGREEPSPVPGLDFELRRYGTRDWTHGGRTNAEGQAELALPVSLLAGDSDGRKRWLEARITSSGYQQALRRVTLPQAAPQDGEAFEVSLPALVGGTVRGRLFDAAGVPCAGDVRLEPVVASSSWRPTGRGKAAADGRFELHLAVGGAHHLSAAGRPGRNSGTLKEGPLDIDLLHPPQELELRLVGTGSVRGRVLDAGGRPAAGLNLLVLAHEADVGEGSFVVPDEIGQRLENRGAGFYWRTGLTDAAGAFEFFGLLETAFVVRARTDGGRGYPHLLTPQPVPAGGEPLVLRMDRTYLVVRAHDTAGAPVPLTPASADFRAPYPEHWPHEARVAVAPAPESARSSESGRRLLPGRSVAPGEVVYDLEPGRDYLVTLLAQRQPAETRRVELRADSGRVECVFTTVPNRPTGVLSVTVLDPTGQPLFDDLSVRLVDPNSGSILLDRRRFYRKEREQDWPARFEVPAGEYRLEVESLPFVDSHHGTLMTPRAHGGASLPVIVQADGTTEVSCLLSEAARLRLSLRGNHDAEDLVAVRRPGWEEELVRDLAGAATVLLFGEGGYPQEVEYAADSSMWGMGLSGSWKLGSDQLSEALTPGTYTLEARLPGGRTIARPVVLEPGKTLDLELDFTTARKP